MVLADGKHIEAGLVREARRLDDLGHPLAWAEQRAGLGVRRDLGDRGEPEFHARRLLQESMPG
jgi:hypothetical protein